MLCEFFICVLSTYIYYFLYFSCTQALKEQKLCSSGRQISPRKMSEKWIEFGLDPDGLQSKYIDDSIGKRTNNIY